MKKFSTKLNDLSKYALEMANMNLSKIEIFLSGLRSDIVKDVMIRDQITKSYLEALNRVQISNVIG